MSYSEKDGEVILTMSREDAEQEILRLLREFDGNYIHNSLTPERSAALPLFYGVHPLAEIDGVNKQDSQGVSQLFPRATRADGRNFAVLRKANPELMRRY